VRRRKRTGTRRTEENAQTQGAFFPVLTFSFSYFIRFIR